MYSLKKQNIIIYSIFYRNLQFIRKYEPNKKIPRKAIFLRKNARK